MKNMVNNILKKYKFDKKISKLKNDPDLFFKDLVNNKKNKLVQYVPISTKGENNFTIVTAVYNAEKYLDDFFKSIVGQTLSFKHNIFIVCVDDGSVDGSEQIIEKWINKYPNNIKYFYKENGGQASARNLGLKHVKTQWVTFTDPDDFLNKNFFLNLEHKILKIKDIKMLVSNMIFYFEKDKKYKNTHPLKYRFDEKEASFSIKDLKNNIILSAATTIFEMQTIKENNLEFDANIKPVFEDGKFVADYCLASSSGQVCFVKESQYFYRKREDQSSTLDTSWADLGKFDNVLRYGHLAMLQNYHDEYGKVPKFIQRTTLYDITWYLKYLLNEETRTSHLTPEQKKTFLNLLNEIFQYINVETIHAFNLAGIWFKQKVGILGFFKDEPISNQIIYVENFDKEKKQLKLSFFSYFDAHFIFKLNGVEVIPTHLKQVNNTFIGQNFIQEYVIWLPYQSVLDQLEIMVDGNISRISIKGKHYKKVLVQDIHKEMQNYKNYSNDGSWILIDRDTQADDNAEHLYRYIKNNNLKDDCYFALRKESPDWQRLKNEGFKLLDFGSKEFEIHLKSCDKIISSHLDKYVNNYFGDEYGYTKKFIFLQHGITKDDLSSWFNTKKNLFSLITSTQDEYLSIANGENYKMTKKDVILSGFPRHDTLAINCADEKCILIMPTWRNHLVGNTIGLGDERPFNAEFYSSDYARCWKALLEDPNLKTLSESLHYKIIFAPHANIVPYLSGFNVPNYIDVWSKVDSNLSIQDLFKKSKFLITDYSSVAFEMAYLGKQTIYYQFDAEEVFSGSHTYKKGYFEYEQHGFGPVVYEHDAVIQEVSKLIKNDGVIFDEYLARIEKTFIVRDQNNCKRVYEHLVKMDEYEQDEYILDIHSLCEMIELAYKNYDLESLNTRLNYLFKFYPNHELCEKYQKVSEYLKGIFFEQDQCIDVSKINTIPYIEETPSESILNYDYSLKYPDKFLILLNNIKSDVTNLECVELIELLKNNKYHDFLDSFDQKILENSTNLNLDINQINLDLMYLSLLIYEERYTDFWNYTQTLNLLYRTREFRQQLRILEFRVLFVTQDLNKAVKVYEELLEKDDFIGLVEDVEKYCEALLTLKEMSILDEILATLIQKYPESHVLMSINVELLTHHQNYGEVLSLFETDTIELDVSNKYVIIKSLYIYGDFEKAHSLVQLPNRQDSFEYWLLCWELALQCENKTLDSYCRKHIWAYFPNKIKENLPKINLMLNMLVPNRGAELV